MTAETLPSAEASSDPSTGSSAGSAEIGRLRHQLEELTDAHVLANEQFLALHRLSEFSSASLDPEVAVKRTVDEARTLLGAAQTAYRVGGDATSPNPTLSYDRGDGQTALVVPVRSDDQYFGVLEVVSSPRHRFSTADMKLTEALCNQLAMVLKLSTLHHEAIERTIIERDYNTASILAQAALNRPLPVVEGLELATFNRPARAAGGDFYAAARCGDGLYLALGDVSGKGLPAALIMSSATSATYSAFERCSAGTANVALSEIDRQLSSYLAETGLFITIVVAYVDLKQNQIQLSNAGHSPVIITQDGKATNSYADGPPIGVLEARTHGSRSWDFNPGDMLFLGTDGCTDQTNAGGALFGEDRVTRLIGNLGNIPATEVLTRLTRDVDEFAGDEDQIDDLTAMVVRRDPEGQDK